MALHDSEHELAGPGLHPVKFRIVRVGHWESEAKHGQVHYYEELLTQKVWITHHFPLWITMVVLPNQLVDALEGVAV